MDEKPKNDISFKKPKKIDTTMLKNKESLSIFPPLKPFLARKKIFLIITPAPEFFLTILFYKKKGVGKKDFKNPGGLFYINFLLYNPF